MRVLTDRKKLAIAIEALKQCSNPAGAYNLDRLSHAENTIKNMQMSARIALHRMGVDFNNVKIDQ